MSLSDEDLINLKYLVEVDYLSSFGIDVYDVPFAYRSSQGSGQQLPSLPSPQSAKFRDLVDRIAKTEEVVEFEVFEGELRPGSGMVRMKQGMPYGFQGCVGLFLNRTEPSADRFLLTAGHLLSEDWEEGVDSEVFRTGSGSSGSGRPRKLGRVKAISKILPAPSWNRFDAAVVQLGTEVEIDPETTCYDHLGELPDKFAAEAFKGGVLKCGNEEPIFTEGRVKAPRFWFAIHREVKGVTRRFLFEDQLLVESGHYPRPFARPGDSGCAVIDADDRKIFGLILGGSVLRDLFIVNRADHLFAFLEEQHLVYEPDRLATRTMERPRSSASLVAESRSSLRTGLPIRYL